MYPTRMAYDSRNVSSGHVDGCMLWVTINSHSIVEVRATSIMRRPVKDLTTLHGFKQSDGPFMNVMVILVSPTYHSLGGAQLAFHELLTGETYAHGALPLDLVYPF